MSRNTPISKEIQDEHLDMLIYLAFKMEEEEEIQSLLSEEARELSAEDMTHKSLAYALFLEKLDAQQKKEQRKQRIHLWKSRVPKLIEIAACLILILGISAPIAVAHVECIRVMVMDLLIEMQGDHAKVRLIENEEGSFEVPAEWKGEYFPTYIPEGFEVSWVNEVHDQIEFTHSGNSWLLFSENTSCNVLHMDVEQADISHTTINGSEAIVVEKDEITSIAWQYDDKYFSISCKLSYDEMRKVAESVSRIID